MKPEDRIPPNRSRRHFAIPIRVLLAWVWRHTSDVLIVALTAGGVWVGWKIPNSINEQDSQYREEAARNEKIDSDLGRINALIAGVLGEEDEKHVVEKRAVARAIYEYAIQGLVATSSTEVLFHYLEGEADPQVHCYLFNALDRAVNNLPHTVEKNPRSQKDAERLAEWEIKTRQQKEQLRRLKKANDVIGCRPLPPQVGPPTPPPYRQYLDVGCGAITNSPPDGQKISLDSNYADKFVIRSASAQFVDTSNLKAMVAEVIRVDPDGALVKYSIVGRDRELFGNCPGGGHGTLVVTFQLARKEGK